MRYIHVGNVYKPMSNGIHDFKEYKKAKVHLEKLEAIHLLFVTSIRGLELFAAYQTADRAIIKLKEEKSIIEIQIAKCKATLISKGKT